MSRRRKDGARREPAERRSEAPEAAAPGAEAREAEARGSSLLVQTGILVAVFLVTSLIAELAGAANLGVAISVGQIAFAVALVALLLRAP